ncbi:hypothetical protein CAPTEDRAFT_160899 [Capitella teleta]|uniref:Tetraspanin n=1 Tax=Capitella teleta TaxID=283909 RepID=R7V5G3_CAPTE|nr:hypothetical protein CAPTEDRAFT_160899 [Capitella teleta]|eukprot:ELU13799.1 hypothetical protein CAPTEDRAFT_160899 [Capitella teleta]
MGSLSKTAKLVLVILSFLFWAAAGGLFFVAGYVFSGYPNFEEIVDAYYTLLPATIIAAVGVFFLLLGIVGCIGACKEQKCLLCLFFSFMLIIFIGLVVGGVLAYFYRKDIDSAVGTGIEKCMTKYGNDTICTGEIDFMQSQLKCCGADNYTDWADTAWVVGQKNASVHFPPSCCANNDCHYNAPTLNQTGVFLKGCHPTLKTNFMDHLGVIAGVAGAFAILQLLGLIFSSILMCRRRADVPYIGLNDPDGMRI